MPTIYDSPRYARLFTQKQTIFGAVNNSSGTWASSGAQYQRVEEGGYSLTPIMPKNVPGWLTGTLSQQQGILGRRSATCSFQNMDLIPSGTAGTAPDCDHLLYSGFGTAATIVSSTSVTYNLSDNAPDALTVLEFRHSQATLTQRLIWGVVVAGLEFTFNQNFLKFNTTMAGAYLLDSNNFSNEDTTGKAALTVYPTEPGSVSTAGVSIPGFGGTAVMDSGALACEIVGMTIRMDTGSRVPNDVLCSPYGAQIVRGPRRVGVKVDFKNSDLAALNDLKVKAKSNTAIPVVVTIGSAAGSRVVFTLPDLQLIPNDYQDQTDQRIAQFPDSPAAASAIGTTDELQISFT